MILLTVLSYIHWKGGADINFNDKSFTATPDVVIHGAKTEK